MAREPHDPNSRSKGQWLHSLSLGHYFIFIFFSYWKANKQMHNQISHSLTYGLGSKYCISLSLLPRDCSADPCLPSWFSCSPGHAYDPPRPSHSSGGFAPCRVLPRVSLVEASSVVSWLLLAFSLETGEVRVRGGRRFCHCLWVSRELPNRDSILLMSSHEVLEECGRLRYKMNDTVPALHVPLVWRLI